MSSIATKISLLYRLLTWLSLTLWLKQPKHEIKITVWLIKGWRCPDVTKLGRYRWQLDGKVSIFSLDAQMESTSLAFIDSSASMALEDLIQKLRESDDTVILFGGRARVIQTLRKTRVPELLDPNHIVSSRLEALRTARAYLDKSTNIARR